MFIFPYVSINYFSHITTTSSKYICLPCFIFEESSVVGDSDVMVDNSVMIVEYVAVEDATKSE